MKRFLKPKLIFPLVTLVMLTAAIAVPLMSGSITHSHAAGAHSDTVTYNYFAGSGPVCSVSPTACPDVASASNGDTISISGQGILSIQPNSVAGSGTFIHMNAKGKVLSEGVWIAQQLLSFVSFGTAPPFPPSFKGGKALVRIHLAPNRGGAGFEAVLRITCLIGSPPAGANEGIRLNIQDGINFNKEVSGNTLFVLTSKSSA